MEGGPSYLRCQPPQRSMTIGRAALLSRGIDLLSLGSVCDLHRYARAPVSFFFNFNVSFFLKRFGGALRHCATDLPLHRPIQACVEQIKKVDTDDALYRRIVGQPFLNGNAIAADSIFNLSHVAQHVREAFRQHGSYLLPG